MFSGLRRCRHRPCQSCGQLLAVAEPFPACRTRASTFTTCLGLLVGIWLLRLLFLAVLQRTTHIGLGLNLWPCGEDMNWLCLMQEKTGTSLAKTFWALDNRNPLSVWWYILARPLLSAKSGHGFFMARRISDLACGLCVFLLLDRLGRGRHRLFAFSCALLTLLWNFGYRFDDVIWVFLGALCFSLLSLWAYCKYVDTDRRKGRYLALSLIFYLVAIGTYTLQASAFLPVIVLGLCRPAGAPPTAQAWKKRIRLALGEFSLFAAVFLIFLLLWITCSSQENPGQSCSLSLASRQLKQSLHQLFWHDSNTMLLRSLVTNWKAGELMLAGLGGLGCFAFLLGRITFGKAWRNPESQDKQESWRKAVRSDGSVLAYAGAVMVGISALTIAVESVSPVWFPGTRTPMLEQVLQPLLYGSMVFALTCLPGRLRRLARTARWASVSALSTVVFLVGLEYNRLQVASTVFWKKQILAAVRELDPYTERPLNILIKLDDLPVPGYDLRVVQHYIQKHYNSRLLNVVVLQKKKPGVELARLQRGSLWTGRSGDLHDSCRRHKRRHQLPRGYSCPAAWGQDNAPEKPCPFGPGRF